MDFRFDAYDPSTGAYLRAMPAPVKAQIGDVFGDRGTLELEYAGAPDIPTFLEIRAQVYHGGQWAPAGPSYIRLSGSHADTDPAGMRSIKFVSREWLLGKARVGEGELELIDGKRPFYQASPGAIMRTLLLEAQDRGAARGIELSSFDSAVDSAGVPWSKVATIYYSPSLPIGDVLSNLVEQGMCDYRMEGNTIHLFEPETAMGRDLTTGGSPVRVQGSVTEAPVSYTLEDLTTSALLIGEEGFQVEVDNPSAPDDYGRLEVTIEQGGVNSEGTARTMIDAELQRGSREVRQITRTQHASAAPFLPFRDYRVGDFVQAFDLGAWERYRVREIQMVRDGSGWTVHTVLNDRLEELLLRLASRTNGIVNGTRGSGGDGTRPTPPPAPGIEPAAPEGLVIDQQVYLDASGDARGLITAGWGAVTESTRGVPIDIGGYELWRRDNETYAPWRLVSRTDGALETTDSPVWLTRADGTPWAYQWRVRAIAEASGREGPWSAPVTLTMTQDTTPPPVPSTPTVTTGYRIVTATWDGLTVDGTIMPSDFSRVRVYTAATENMADADLAGSMPYQGDWNSGTMPAGVPVWVAFTAVDRVGNESAMTPAVSVTPQALVDEESIVAEVGRIDQTIADAEAELREDIENIVIDGNGNVITWSPTQPAEGKNGDTWFETSGSDIIGHHGYLDGVWVERQLTDETIASLNAGKINAGFLDAARIQANSVTADKLLIGSTWNSIPNGDLRSGDTSGWPDEFSYGDTDPAPNLPGYATLPYVTQGIVLDDMAQFPVKIGDEVVLEFWAMAEVPGGTLSLIVGDQDGNILAITQGSTWTIDEGTTSAAAYPFGIVDLPTEWTLYRARITITSPAITTATFAAFSFSDRGSPDPAALVKIAGLAMYRSVGQTLIADGSITTEKIVAESITSDLLRTGAVQAGHIAANAVEADKIDAGAIDGKLITGATIQTSATGARVVLDRLGLIAYNQAGDPTFTISATTGGVDMLGNLRQQNSYGRVVFGPELFNGTNLTPALSFSVPGVNWFGGGGLYARGESGGNPVLPDVVLQGFFNTDTDGSLLQLAPGGSSTGASTALQRLHWQGGFYGITMSADGSTSVGALDQEMDVRLRSFSGTTLGRMTMSRSGGIQIRGGNTGNQSGFSLGDANSRSAQVDARGGIASLYSRPASGTANSAYITADYSNDTIQIVATDINLFRLTTAAGTTLVQSGSKLYRTSSSRKYKVGIEDVEYILPDVEDRLLSVRARTWWEKGNAEHYSAYLDKLAAGGAGPDEEELVPVPVPHRSVGAIAEEVDELGLSPFVLYDGDGAPEGLAYDRFGVALIPIVKRLRDRVDELERRLGEMNG